MPLSGSTLNLLYFLRIASSSDWGRFFSMSSFVMPSYICPVLMRRSSHAGDAPILGIEAAFTSAPLNFLLQTFSRTSV